MNNKKRSHMFDEEKSVMGEETDFAIAVDDNVAWTVATLDGLRLTVGREGGGRPSDQSIESDDDAGRAFAVAERLILGAALGAKLFQVEATRFRRIVIIRLIPDAFARVVRVFVPCE
jgi:hypothetical protein